MKLTTYQRLEAYKYLIELRNSHTVPMDTNYTATYLCDVFGYDYETCRTLLLEWLTWINPLILDTSSPD